MIKISHLYCVWAIKNNCSFFKIEPKLNENNIFDYEILGEEQLNFDFIEIIFNKQKDGNGSKVSFKESTFDLICFCDSLHFTQTDKELYAILDKCLLMLKPNGKLAIFCGNNSEQLDIWGQNNNIPVQIVDLIETNKKLWCNVFSELITMSSELRKEVPETYERIKSECIEKLQWESWSPRWLYIFNNKKQQRINSLNLPP
ncbi:MAG: class I SAM-dependent methyltransferase [Oscillospiraceae bacterium]|nr:class I SAM-dependent methyltransferase [Oscillospiraceae bacterium]